MHLTGHTHFDKTEQDIQMLFFRRCATSIGQVKGHRVMESLEYS